MKKLSKLKLNQLVQSDLEKKEMSSILGGSNCCVCGCKHAQNGGSSTADNGNANNAADKYSPNGGWAYCDI